MQACYPIHPELFDRLYNEWSSLDKFQRTRGVLRLMATVIHSLWESNDAGLLIMPSSVPIHDPNVQSELVRYLEDSWVPVIERDIDGGSSLPLRLDRENPTMGRYSACRRVARTIYMASAPTVQTANRGTDDRHIRLGCVQPGESVATFGDALRRLTDQALHLYMDKSRYWYSTQPSVLSVAKDRAAQLSDEAVEDEIKRRLQQEQTNRGAFMRVHACPMSSADVPDDLEARLVILSPEHPHQRNQGDSRALQAAQEILTNRGGSPRQYRNTLAFLAADQRQLASLQQGVRDYLAWESIEADKGAEGLNLDAFQAGQATTKREQADDTVKQRIPETWTAVLAPYQEDPRGEMAWQVNRPLGSGSLAERAANRLQREEALITKMAGTRLRIELDRIPLWQGEHVATSELVDYFARYVYLPRIVEPATLAAAVADGVGLMTWKQDAFAYADGWDEAAKRYIGLKAGTAMSLDAQSSGLVVKSQTAAAQLAQEEIESKPPNEVREGSPDQGTEPDTAHGPQPPKEPAQPKRFFGACQLDSMRLSRDAASIADEVIQHLASLLGAEVNVTLEIRADIPGGVPENIVRIVTENCRTLRFESQEFEGE